MEDYPQEERAWANGRRIRSPSVTAADLAELVSGCNAFAWDLYHVLGSREGNLLASPLSISLALAMAYAGARGETQAQMAQALHLTLAQERLHPAFNHLDLELSSRGRGMARTPKALQLSIANAIWSQEGVQFLAQFLDALVADYGAGVRLLDFAGAPERCRDIVNAWASDHTRGRIRDLIPPGAIRRRTKLLITNAVAFCALWSLPFRASRTADGKFHLLDGSTTVVPMMQRTGSFAYAELNGVRAVELRYKGDELAMAILLPPARSFEAFEKTVQVEKVGAILQSLSYRSVALTMPKFRFACGFRLADALATMGMPVAFSDDADFSGMTGGTDLFVSDVLHKAFVAVDEEGTEAAAATAAVMVPTMAPPRSMPIDLCIDHPFLFVIRDIQTGTLLFVGRVLEPEGS